MSNATMIACLDSVFAFLRLSTALSIASIVPLPFLNPNCLSDSRPFTSRWYVSLVAKILSYTFPIVGNKHTGLSRDPPGFGIQAISACFHTLGKLPSLRQRLNTSSISPPTASNRCSSPADGKPSMPGAFFFGFSWMVLLSSCWVISLAWSSFHSDLLALVSRFSAVSAPRSSSGKYFRMSAIAVSVRFPAQFPSLSWIGVHGVAAPLFLLVISLYAGPHGFSELP
jgi:hypothetical protein